MEEDRSTRRALDELADLFLTDSSVNADRSSQPDAEQTDAHGGSAPERAPEPRSVTTGAFHDELVGPDPVRLDPKLPHAARADDDTDTHAAHDDDWDDIAPSPDTDADDPHQHPGAPHLRLHRDDGEDTAPASEAASDVDAPFDADPVDVAVSAAIRRGQAHSAASTATDDPVETDTPPATDRATQRPATATAVRAEAVLMGNLPGLSGPWLTQYAQLLAQHLGPVALLHVDEQNIDVELVEPTDRPQSSGRVPPRQQQPADGLIDKLDRLMQPGPAQVQAVLVHSEASSRPVAMQRLKALDHWTVLCGADDAAIIGAYRLVKSLVEADATVAHKHLGVMVVGSEHEVGRAAAEKLSASTRPLLESPARFVGCQRQMVPVHLRQLGRFGPTATLWPRVADWLADLPGASEPLEAPLTVSETATAVNPPDLEATAPPDPEPADFAAAEQADEPTPFGSGLDQFTDRPEEPAPLATAPSATHIEGSPEMARSDWTWLHKAGAVDQGPRAAETTTAQQQHQPQPSTDDTTSPDSAPGPTSPPTDPVSAPPAHDEPDLASFLTARDGALAGGVALEARCPQQPRTQIVLDQQGRLHLLRRHHSAEPSNGDSMDGLRRALVDLLEARRWVRQHLELLQLTQRQCRFDGDAEPVLHLFTDRANLATGLGARLGDMLRLHLLQQVRVGEQSTWFCTPLS